MWAQTEGMYTQALELTEGVKYSKLLTSLRCNRVTDILKIIKPSLPIGLLS
jgi:hypothetical protein